MRARLPLHLLRHNSTPLCEPDPALAGGRRSSSAYVREEDAGLREAGAPLDLKMPLENGGADEMVSRGQASERAVCVCETVSVEKGARRPPLPTAVVCPPSP